MSKALHLIWMIPLVPSDALRSFNTVYLAAADAIPHIDPVRDADKLLDSVADIAAFAMNHHSGRFADGRLENPLLRTGDALDTLCQQTPEPEIILGGRATNGKRRVLHVASQTTQVGGHTRTIENWVKTDHSSQHSLFITSQQERPLRQELVDSFAGQSGTVALSRERQTRLERALQLRRFAKDNADIIVLHHHPNDVIPIVAFSTKQVPPVALLNHADHIFWLGSSIADVVVNLREIGANLSEERRAISGNAVLPIPLAKEEIEMERKDARQLFGIPHEATVFLTVGRSLKYRSTSHGNFFCTAQRILDHLPGSRLLIVGMTAEAAETPFRADGRFVFAGERPSSLEARCAADVYLEGFPFGSQTAALEAARSGLPLVLAFAPPTPHLATSIDCLRDVVPIIDSEEEYIAQAVRYGSDAHLRTSDGRAVRTRVLQNHVGEGWVAGVQKVYAQFETQPHRCRDLPLGSMQCDAGDQALAMWQYESAEPYRTFDEFLRNAAYGMRNRGLYKAAFRILQASLCSRGAIVPTVLAMAKLGPHWLLNRSSAGAN